MVKKPMVSAKGSEFLLDYLAAGIEILAGHSQTEK